MEHFIPHNKINESTHISNLFFKEVLILHGLPKSIFSDKDTKLVGDFWQTLWKKMGIKLCLISSYHPKLDGKTKFINISLGNIL